MAATETLLVVENETAIKTLVQMALERHGYVVLTAESGSEALRLSAAHDGPMDLLISDVVMPVLRGP
jgi:CheY-like chemotaxis protein